MQNVDVAIVMTDDDVHQEALQDWLKILSRLWTAYGKPIDPEQMVIYRDMLGSLPLGLLEKAIDQAVRDHAYNSVPIVKEVWDAVRKELDNPFDIDQAIEQWRAASWQRCVVRCPGVAAETEGS